MQKLDNTYFPHAGMRNLRFKTKDGVVHTGRYDFNDTWARRWFDEDNKEYTSDLVEEWEEHLTTQRCTVCGQVIPASKNTISMTIGSTMYFHPDNFCTHCKEKEYRTIRNEIDVILRMHGFKPDYRILDFNQ